MCRDNKTDNKTRQDIARHSTSRILSGTRGMRVKVPLVKVILLLPVLQYYFY